MGVCRLYIDEGADLGMALRLAHDGKVQRPGVCNAPECLLVHEKEDRPGSCRCWPEGSGADGVESAGRRPLPAPAVRSEGRSRAARRLRAGVP